MLESQSYSWLCSGRNETLSRQSQCLEKEMRTHKIRKTFTTTLINTLITLSHPFGLWEHKKSSSLIDLILKRDLCMTVSAKIIFHCPWMETGRKSCFIFGKERLFSLLLLMLASLHSLRREDTCGRYSKSTYQNFITRQEWHSCPQAAFLPSYFGL